MNRRFVEEYTTLIVGIIVKNQVILKSRAVYQSRDIQPYSRRAPRRILCRVMDNNPLLSTRIVIVCSIILKSKRLTKSLLQDFVDNNSAILIIPFRYGVRLLFCKDTYVEIPVEEDPTVESLFY